jgi:hypothetical protein
VSLQIRVSGYQKISGKDIGVAEYQEKTRTRAMPDSGCYAERRECSERWLHCAGWKCESKEAC